MSKYPYTEHDDGIVLDRDEADQFRRTPMTPAQLAAREPALAIAKDIYRHANQAGVCYYEFWLLISKTIQGVLDAAPRPELGALHWLDNNMTHFDTVQPAEGPNVPVLAKVSKRIWYHATDDQESWPFSNVLERALKEAAPTMPAMATSGDAVEQPRSATTPATVATALGAALSATRTIPPPLPYERVIAWTRMMPRDGNEYAMDRWSVMDVEACIAGAMKEQYEAIIKAAPYREANYPGDPTAPVSTRGALPDEYHVFKDGNAWCAVGKGFIDLQASKAGFGHTPLVALGELIVEEGEITEGCCSNDFCMIGDARGSHNACNTLNDCQHKATPPSANGDR